jgi:hypothetical protein
MTVAPATPQESLTNQKPALPGFCLRLGVHMTVHAPVPGAQIDEDRKGCQLSDPSPVPSYQEAVDERIAESS